VGVHPAQGADLLDGHAGEAIRPGGDRVPGEPVAVDELGILLVQGEVEGGELRDSPRNADRAGRIELDRGEDVANMCGGRLEVGGEALGEAAAAEGAAARGTRARAA